MKLDYSIGKHNKNAFSSGKGKVYPMNACFSSVVVAGLGLIGASFAGAYHRVYPDATITGIDISSESLKEGISRGWIQKDILADDKEAILSAFKDADLIVIATPVPVAEAYFKLITESGYEGIVTDTCSTKALVAKQAQELLRFPNNYIPGHPMAGSEKSGIEGSKEDLFQGAHWVLCPDENTPAENFAALHEMLTHLGARVVSLSRDSHDEAVAIVSHVPHFVASSLVELAVRHAGNQEALFRLAAGGFKDSTRIAAGSPTLWTGIAFDNSEAIVDGLEEVREILGEFSSALAKKDKQEFTRLLDRAAVARRSLPAKWVPVTEDLLEVRIPLTDRKGIIAEVTTIASQVGCNIQSIDIDHITSSSAVLSLVLTDEGDIGKLSTSLIKAGFSISFNPLFAKENDYE